MSVQAADSQKTDAGSALEYLPVGLFGSVMGLTGLSVAWRFAGARYGFPPLISEAIGIIAVATFIVLAIAYLTKAATAPGKVVAEFHHPIAGNLFGTIPISLLLLPVVIAPVNLLVAQVMWFIGAVAMAVFAWLIVDRWMSDRQQVAHATPAWIIPVVGLLDVPLAVPVLDLPPMHGVMMFGLAVGLFFAVPLFTVIFSRLVFEPPMPDAMLPSLLILIAPFAVGFSTYAVTVGQVDRFAEALFMLTLFLLSVLLGRLRQLRACCPFRVSWWAVSFPLAASSIAALRFAAANPSAITDAIALVLLALATVTIAGLLIRTLAGVAAGELRTLAS
jgi:tellurite resistance protein